MSSGHRMYYEQRHALGFADTLSDSFMQTGAGKTDKRIPRTLSVWFSFVLLACVIAFVIWIWKVHLQHQQKKSLSPSSQIFPLQGAKLVLQGGRFHVLQENFCSQSSSSSDIALRPQSSQHAAALGGAIAPCKRSSTSIFKIVFGTGPDVCGARALISHVSSGTQLRH